MVTASRVAMAYAPFEPASIERRLNRLRTIRSKADQEIAVIEAGILNEIRDRRSLLSKVDQDIAALEKAISIMSESAMTDASPTSTTMDPFDRHHDRSRNQALGWSSTREVLSTAYRILLDSRGGMKRRDLFKAVQSTGLTMPGTNAVKNFGTLVTRSDLFTRGNGRYHAVKQVDGS
jgi:hypothetical protein